MRKIRKYIDPVAFSAVFLILFTGLKWMLSVLFERGNLAPLGWAGIFLGAWAFLAVPIFCVIYSKRIYKEKRKYLFAVYHSAVVSLSHLMLFDFDRQSYIYGVAFVFWVACWTVLSVLWRAYYEKQ